MAGDIGLDVLAAWQKLEVVAFLATGIIDARPRAGNLTSNVAGIALPDVPSHPITIPTDECNRAALHLRDVLKSTCRNSQGRKVVSGSRSCD